MSSLVLLGLLPLAGCLALSLLLWREQRETTRLRGRLETTADKLQNLQRSFSRFAPDEVIERVIADGAENLGENKEVTVLFADLVGFTALSQQLEPPVLVRILNGYFEHMNQAISEHRGYVSTFIGDGILALFGALTPNPWQINDAAHAALGMRAALARYNRELASEALPSLALGIGLQHGTGVAGLVGSRDLMEFTVVGRTVNIAARVQELTRHLDADIIVTEEVRTGLDPGFALTELPPTAVKGVAEPIPIFSIRDYVATTACAAHE